MFKNKSQKKKIVEVSLIIIIGLVITILIFYLKTSDTILEVEVGKLNFVHLGEEHYVSFEATNKVEEEKSCIFEIITGIEKSKSGATLLKPNSKKMITLPAPVPEGKSNIEVVYTCK